MLKPFVLKAPADGVVASSMHEGSTVGRRTPLARIEQSDRTVVEIRSPLPGRVNKILKPNGSQVARDEDLLSLNSDEGTVWEALRALAIVGTTEDLPLVQSYEESASGRVKEQADLTAKAISNRSSREFCGRCRRRIGKRDAVHSLPIVRRHHLYRIPRTTIKKRAVRALAGALLATDAKVRIDFDSSKRRMIFIGYPEHACFNRAILDTCW